MEITLILRANLAAGTYTATLTVSGDGIAESVTVTYRLIYNGRATAPEQFVPLSVCGVYVAVSGNQRVKTVY
ncbi:hypothetical protein FACS189426_02350 [Bacteroidia bacterium]|nr:hypothetical protein FACS189426_02350 [Bacteroidia bacterium]